MSERKWTKGPWVLGEVVDGGGTSKIQVFNKCDELVCNVIGSNTPLNDSVVGRYFLNGNSHLIAAAPDLYEALEDLFKELTLGDVELPTSLKPEIAQAARALAKARGEK